MATNHGLGHVKDSSRNSYREPAIDSLMNRVDEWKLMLTLDILALFNLYHITWKIK